MANDVGCNLAGGNCRYDHNALMSNRKDVRPQDDQPPSIVGSSMVLVGPPSGPWAIWSWEGGEGGWGANPSYTYTQTDMDNVGGGKKEPGDGDGDDTGGEPPSFPSTGPVFTPLDLTAPNQNPYYSYNYPDYAPDTGANFQSQGLLTQNIGYGGADPYQPWSQQYGDEYFSDYGGENLWNYQPPSIGPKPFNYDLSKGPGPKVGFSK